MIEKLDSEGYRDMAPGIRMKTMCYGEKTLMARFQLDAGSTLPLHDHPHEQTGTLVSGHIVFLVDGKEIDTTPGDCWCFRGGEVHGVRVLEDSVLVEVFSPVREAYLPH